MVEQESSLLIILRTSAYCGDHVCKLEVDHYYLNYVTLAPVDELGLQVEKHPDLYLWMEGTKLMAEYCNLISTVEIIYCEVSLTELIVDIILGALQISDRKAIHEKEANGFICIYGGKKIAVHSFSYIQ